MRPQTYNAFFSLIQSVKVWWEEPTWANTLSMALNAVNFVMAIAGFVAAVVNLAGAIKGLAAACQPYVQYRRFLKQARKVDVTSGQDQSVFYSGKGNRAKAEAFARLNGKTTLEMTPGGKYFDDLNLFKSGSPISQKQAYKIWKTLSKRFAQAAKGNAHGFVNGASPAGIFNTVEFPVLQNNLNITNIFTELFF